MKNQGLYFYGLAAAAYVITSLVIASVRWFHMCRPYDRNPRYYYPGRRAATLIYLSALLIVPYVLRPDSHLSWLLVKAYFLPVDLYFLAILLLSYFGGVKQWKKWRFPIVSLGVIAGLSLLAALAWTVSGSNKEASDIIEYFILGIGVIITSVCLWATRVVMRWAREADDEDYSNPEDFPVNFARKTVIMLYITMILLWITAISGSKTVMAVLHLFMCVASVLLLISALHPHRHGSPIEEENQDYKLGKNRKKGNIQVKKTAYYSRNIADDKVQEIIDAIRVVVEHREAFLEPHLTMQDVADRTGYNRTYVAAVFKNHLGGFFTYVNTLRLDYADQYRKKHPKASVVEVSNESGFNSRTTYYTVQAKIRPEK